MTEYYDGQYRERLADQHGAAVHALRLLDIYPHEGIPSRDQVLAGIGSITGDWLDQRWDAGHYDELVIGPSVRAYGLIGDEETPGLVRRFDRANRHSDRSSLTETENWVGYNDAESTPQDRAAIHDNGDPSKFSTVIMLNDRFPPGHPELPINSFSEPGLLHTDMELDKQRFALMAEQEVHGAEGRIIASATIGQIIALNTIRLDQMEPVPLDPWQTVTRLIHYQAVITNHGELIPMVRGAGRRLTLGNATTKRNPSNGIRRVLRIPIAT